MPPRRQAAPKAESKTGLVVALIFFILTTITLGAVAYMGFDGQKELESKANAAKSDADKANNAANEARAKYLAARYMMGLETEAKSADELGALNSNAAFRSELATINRTFGTWGVGWDPKTDTPPESILVVLKKLQSAKETAEKNADAALAQRDKAQKEFEQKDATNEAKVRQAETKQTEFAKTAADAQKAEQDAKTFQVNTINDLKAKMNQAANKAATDIANLNTEKGRLVEDLTGAKEANQKLKANQDAQRAKILLTDIKHGEVTQVDTATDTAYINLGTSDSVRPGMSFSVLQSYDRSQYSAEAALPKKATLAVTQVLGPRQSRVSIKYADDVNPLKEPVRAHDGLYKPGWKPGTPVRWALAGHFDLNGLGRDETEILKKRLERQGIIVDAYLDLRTLKIVGDLNYNIDYLIVGNRPTGETARIIGEDRKKEIEDAINAMVRKAQEMGITVMQHRVFLPIAGIELPRQQAFPYFPGGGAGGAPAGDAPKDDKPKDDKTKEDKGKDEGK